MEYDLTGTYSGPTTYPDVFFDSGAYSGVNDSHTLTLCPSFDQPGNYQASLDVTFYDWEYNPIDYGYVTDDFRVAAYVPPVVHQPAPTAHHVAQIDGVSRSHFRRHGWTVSARYMRDWDVARGVQISLQRKDFGQWHTIQRHATVREGSVDFNVTPRRGRAKQYRMVAPANHGAPTAISRTLRFARR
jgi:hypothetical protein